MRTFVDVIAQGKQRESERGRCDLFITHGHNITENETQIGQNQGQD